MKLLFQSLWTFNMTSQVCANIILTPYSQYGVNIINCGNKIRIQQQFENQRKKRFCSPLLTVISD